MVQKVCFFYADEIIDGTSRKSHTCTMTFWRESTCWFSSLIFSSLPCWFMFWLLFSSAFDVLHSGFSWESLGFSWRKCVRRKGNYKSGQAQICLKQLGTVVQRELMDLSRVWRLFRNFHRKLSTSSSKFVPDNFGTMCDQWNMNMTSIFLIVSTKSWFVFKVQYVPFSHGGPWLGFCFERFLFMSETGH